MKRCFTTHTGTNSLKGKHKKLGRTTCDPTENIVHFGDGGLEDAENPDAPEHVEKPLGPDEEDEAKMDREGVLERAWETRPGVAVLRHRPFTRDLMSTYLGGFFRKMHNQD